MSARVGFLASACAAWVLGGLALWLGFYRPTLATGDVSATLPVSIAGFELVQRHEMTPRMHQLLGTEDATWRTYRTNIDGSEVYVIFVVHGANWKSVHPPHLCLRGSNMEPVGESVSEGGDHGVLTMFSHDPDQQQNYVSVFRYGADGLATGEYGDFVLHHAPRAVFRMDVRGWLLRVESWAGRDEATRAAAVARCRTFLDAVTPFLDSLFSAPD